jgi:hypothetical protein
VLSQHSALPGHEAVYQPCHVVCAVLLPFARHLPSAHALRAPSEADAE